MLSCDCFAVNSFPGMTNVALPIEKIRQMFRVVGDRKIPRLLPVTQI